MTGARRCPERRSQRDKAAETREAVERSSAGGGRRARVQRCLLAYACKGASRAKPRAATACPLLRRAASFASNPAQSQDGSRCHELALRARCFDPLAPNKALPCAALRCPALSCAVLRRRARASGVFASKRLDAVRRSPPLLLNSSKPLSFPLSAQTSLHLSTR